jgi:hypothetical protein
MPTARDDAGPDFIEALARGLEVLRTFRPGRRVSTLSEIAADTGLARPTVRRILLTLEALGYVRAADRGYALTPRVLELGMSYIDSLDRWDVARPHMERLVAQTHESTSMAQLDAGDIVYVARVAVPKIVTLAVTIGTRFPAYATAMTRSPSCTTSATWAVPAGSSVRPCRCATRTARGCTRAAGFVPAETTGRPVRRCHNAAAS